MEALVVMMHHGCLLGGDGACTHAVWNTEVGVCIKVTVDESRIRGRHDFNLTTNFAGCKQQ